ncbi:hypothetical protein [Rossellomorea marisflavi]|uniref:hypothetical protein n=1 Tax=Rossellomorea marisflavi TaxID=189381 RepID=UPI003D2F35A7
MSGDLKENLLKDVLKTGFPLEMEISQLFRKSGWQVVNGSYYIDKDEDKGREIDVISTINFDEDLDEGLFKEVLFSLVIEIKKTEEKPWVFFTSETTGHFDKLLPLDAVLAGFTAPKARLRRILRKNLPSIHKRIGRNFYVGFSGNGARDDIYKALSSVVKATQHSLENSWAYNNESGDKLVYVFQPVVVIQGGLFEVFLDEDGEHVVEEVDYIQTQFNYLSSNYPSENRKIIHIVKDEYLPQFIDEQREALFAFYRDINGIN